jgi:chromosome segregation ATPase
VYEAHARAAFQRANYRHRLNDLDPTTEYKKVISVLEKQVKEHERSIDQIYSKHRAAIQDRTQFEKDKRNAEAALQASQQSALAQSTKYQKQISELKADIARLATAGADVQSQQNLGQPLQEAREKIENLEKKLESARKQLDFVTSQYQETRSEAATMRSEAMDLKAQNQRLEQTARNNFVRIHEIQAQSSEKHRVAQISELKALLREREIELERTRDELQQLKNGRRETRQVSMPRSPRMGMMSPRTGRAHGSSTSRGTSPAPGSGTDGAGTTPVPGMQYLTQQTGNARFNHLRQ